MTFKKILSFKHWQLFLLIFICGSFVGPAAPLKYIIHGAAFITSLFWTYAVVVYGQEKLAQMELPTTNFRILKMNVIAFFVLILINTLLISPNVSPEGMSILSMLTALLGIFLIFRVVVIMTKTIVSLELGKNATFDDCIGTFFLLLFFPLGIWSIQPKINRLLGNKSTV